MLLIYILILSFQLLLPESIPMTLSHITCYVTAVMCFFIVQKKIKEKKS